MPTPWIATYRVQFGPDFSFDDAAALAPYFADLGISHLYASPIAKAGSGSTHGYDVCDPTIINPELGGEAGFRRMALALAGRGIGILLDIVPNHMATSPANPYWMDLLEFGAKGPSAAIFDADLSRKVSLPWLSDGAKSGKDGLSFDEASARILAPVGGAKAPIRPRSVASIIAALDGGDRAATLWQALDEGPATAADIAAARAALSRVAAINRAAFDQALAKSDLASVIEDQHWRGINWRKASTELTYRRFFSVAELIGVRVEDSAVFDLVHALPLRLLRERLVEGLRVDHVDGLADPARYCRELREAAGPDAILLLEKILGAGEQLRDWPVDGTTGYEHLDAINQLFIAPEGRGRFRSFLAEKGGLAGDPESRAARAKEELLRGSFDGEVEALVRLAAQLIESHDRHLLKETLIAFMAWFPVYRSYATADTVAAEDRAAWAETLERLGGRYEHSLVTLAQTIVDRLGNGRGTVADSFRQRLQQLTSPAMAKGVEDTELYRDVSLTSANEVGVDLAQLFRTKAEFAAMFSPPDRRGLIPLATHDTKRGPDIRARINGLSGNPDAWIAFVERWIGRETGDLIPDLLDRWLILQTLYGAAPLSTDRMAAYIRKALREASRHSSWTDPDEAYEQGAIDYANQLMAPATPFQAAFQPLLDAGMLDGRRNGIAQTILQLTLPGIPDIYQGTELWDHSLVDPDNRRPVDWVLRRQLLGGDPPELDLEADRIGATKLFVLRTLLRLRKDQPKLFAARLDLLEAMDGWLMLRRIASDSQLLVAVPVRGAAASDSVVVDGVCDGDWLNVLTGDVATIAAGKALVDPRFPFMVLLRDH